jgi:hypothetical protein
MVDSLTYFENGRSFAHAHLSCCFETHLVCANMTQVSLCMNSINFVQHVALQLVNPPFQFIHNESKLTENLLLSHRVIMYKWFA